MGALFDRLGPVPGGELRDGPRRYLLLRPDVLMGTFARLDAGARRAAFDAFAASAEAHAIDSLRAYASSAAGDALLATTAAAAADLGWGTWTLVRDGERLELEVANSPFAAAWSALSGAPDAAEPGAPVCAPVRGLLAALGTLAFARPAASREWRCAAHGAASCRFTAEPA